MRELNKQDMIDVLYGCAVLGTGGGGPLAEGLALMEEHFQKGETHKLISLDELPDDEYVVTPYSCGAPSAKPDPRLEHLEYCKTAPSVLATKALEETLGKKMYAVGSTELGGANTADVLAIKTEEKTAAENLCGLKRDVFCRIVKKKIKEIARNCLNCVDKTP